MKSFDVVVIGAGPAGYIAAIRAAQLGLATACVEEWKTPKGEYALGGTCLNVGCIPSKALLESSENYERVLHQFKAHGITASGVKFDLKTMLERKDRIVGKMTSGIGGLFKKNKVTWLQGHGKLLSGGTTWKIQIDSETVEAKNVIIATEAWKIFTKSQGLDIELGAQIIKVTQSKKGVSIQYDGSEKSSKTFDCDRLIVSVGRVPNTDGLGAENVGLKLDAKGFIEVDQNCRTGLPRVYAVGDVVRGPMLAHKGEDEGVMVAEIIAGQRGHVNYDAIPWVIYTAPEIAWVGKTEQQLKSEGVAYRAGRFPFAYNGRALGREEPEGFVKILADARTDRILGVHSIGGLASELIAEAVVAIEFGASSEDIARISHAHPSMSEVTREAALAVDKRSLNG